jgi:hypothetical protein
VFYVVIKSKAGLAKAAMMRLIIHIDKSPTIVMGQPARSKVRPSSMFPASSPSHFTVTVTIISPIFHNPRGA